MKRTNILAIAVLLLMTLFISSCENEKLEPTPTRQSISPSDFITRSQSAVENINEFYRQNSDNGLESRSDSLGFEERWGNPNYDQLLSLHTANGEELVIAPLQDLITGTVHNLMVGWQQEGSIPLRIVHDNRVLTDLTFNNTPITPTVPVLFELYNSGEDIAEAVRMYAGDISGCIETIPCPWSCLGCIYCAEECGPIGGTGGIPTNNGPHPTGGGGTANPSNNNQGETTDPDCTTEDPSNGPPSGEVFDHPDCVNTCAGTFDTNCDGTLDNFESCNLSISCLLSSESNTNQYLEQNFVNFDDAITWLIQNDPDLAALSYEMENAPPWMYPIIRELAVELVVELIKKRFGLQLSDELTAALNAIQQGDLASFMIAAIDIISEVHPATKGLKALWDASVMGKKAIQIWNKIDAMATSLGDAAMEKIWNAFNSRNRNILKG